jgi:hypothetical protein
MTKGSCNKEPDECESLMSGSEVAAGEGIPLPTITYRDGRLISKSIGYIDEYQIETENS